MSIFDALNARNQPQHDGPLYPQSAARKNRGSFARAAGNTGDLYPQPSPAPTDLPADTAAVPASLDPGTLARYQYLLQNAPQEDLQRAHEEAFSRLSLEQRQLVLQQLVQIIPPCEAAQLTVNPHLLASAATRAELRDPGALPRILAASTPAAAPVQPDPATPGVSAGPYSNGVTDRLNANPIEGSGLYHNPAYDNPDNYNSGYYSPGYGIGDGIIANVLIDIATNVLGSTIADLFFSNRSDQGQ